MPENTLKDPVCSSLTWVKPPEWQVAMVLGRNRGGGFQWGTPLGLHRIHICDDDVWISGYDDMVMWRL